jgi:preprotein translocase subunit SecE
MADKLKIALALLLVAAGVVGYHYLQESAAVLRLLSVLAGLALAVAVLWTSAPGKRFLVFGRESINETKRVVWPSRKEAMQSTAVVVVFAVTMALFLWAVDAGLMLMVNKLMGRSD